MDQPPPPRISFDEVVLWIDANKKPLLAGVAAIGLLGLVYVIYMANAEGREHRATAALYDLQARAVGETNEPSASDYHGLIEQTKGSGVAQHVVIREAAALFSAGKYSEAQQAYEAFARDFDNSPLLPEASFGVATSLEANGKNTEALAKYQEVATRFPQSGLVTRARLGQARMHEAQGDQQQAFRIYQELTSQAGATAQFGQTTPSQVDANIGLRRLIKANPSLLQTNAPASAVTPAVGGTNAVRLGS